MKHINNNGCPPQKIIGRVALLFLSIYLIVSRHISFTALFIFAQKIFFVSTLLHAELLLINVIKYRI